jgi:cytochrome c biogenesis protein CcmG/thiol:disulfide interchange protein DsbE
MLAGPMTPGSALGVRLRPDFGRLHRRHLLAAAVLPLILLALLAAMLVVRGGGSPTAIGAVAPDFAITDVSGQPVRLSELRGRPVIVNFWASWCVPCEDQFPMLREAYERYADDGLAVIGIIYQDRSQAARDFMARHGAEWTAAADPEGRVADAYRVLGPPETFLIARDGTITARALGQFPAAWLDEKVAALMEE